MSTAHRPTFNSARGSNFGGNMQVPSTTVRAIDVPTHTKLLYRDNAPSSTSREDMKRKLDKVDRGVVAEDVPDRGEDVEKKALESGPMYFPEDEDIELSEGSDEESDDEEELMRELARIKQERADEEVRRQAELAVKQIAVKEEQIGNANPLLAVSASANALRRRWDDDTVFKAQTKSAPKQENKFVNDAVRSEFHRKFLNKYIV